MCGMKDTEKLEYVEKDGKKPNKKEDLFQNIAMGALILAFALLILSFVFPQYTSWLFMGMFALLAVMSFCDAGRFKVCLNDRKKMVIYLIIGAALLIVAALCPVLVPMFGLNR